MISLYCAAKYALEGFSEALAYELASQNIVVKIVEPSGGVTGTRFSRKIRSANFEPDGRGNHGLRVNQAMHEAPGADTGDTVTMKITRVEEEPESVVPLALRQALAAAATEIGLPLRWGEGGVRTGVSYH